LFLVARSRRQCLDGELAVEVAGGAVMPESSAKATSTGETHPPRSGPRPRSAWLLAAAVGGVAADEVDDDMISGRTLLRALDTNRDGVVDRDEYMDMAANMASDHDLPNDRLQTRWLLFHERLFLMGDIDGDRHLNERELEYIGFLAHQASLEPPEEQSEDEDFDDFRESEANSRFRRCDTDRDGRVSLEEFICQAERTREMLDFGPELEGIYARADVTCDGALDWRELQYATFLEDWVAMRNAAQV